MPERQTSSSEVTATPEADTPTELNGHHPGVAPENGEPESGIPADAEHLTDRGAGRDDAAEPVAGPGDPSPSDDATAAAEADAATPTAARGAPAGVQDGVELDSSGSANAGHGPEGAPVGTDTSSNDAPDESQVPIAAATDAPTPVLPTSPVPGRGGNDTATANRAPSTPGGVGGGGARTTSDPATTAGAAPSPGPAGGGSAWFNPWDAESTQRIPRGDAAGGSDAGTSNPGSGTPTPGRGMTDIDATVAHARVAGRAGLVGGPASGTDQPTERLITAGTAASAAPGPEPDDGSSDSDNAAPAPHRPSARRRALLIGAAVLVVLAALYAADLALSAGSVPRGVAVAGVQVGGLTFGAAEQRLRAEIEPRSTRPVAVEVGEARAELDPRTAGLVVDWTATLDQAGSQPLNPVTRILSFFTEREVGVVTSTDRPALDAALAELAPIVGRPPAEGTVRFEGTTPVPVDPIAGQELDLAEAATVLERDWATGRVVVLPLSQLPPVTTPAAVAAAVAEVARPAVSGPVTVKGEGGTQGTLTPRDIATALSFRADPGGDLVPELNQGALTEVLTPQLAASETPSRDAMLDFSSGAPVVVPSQDGRGIDYAATFKDLISVLVGTGPRQLTAVYADKPAELTTDELNMLGISGVIGEFTTGGFAADSGKNIKRAAEQIDGTIVKPGETFSLNALTNPRDASNGYVEAGIISDGHPSRGVGGGVSQVATTTYNAAYFAGMTDVAHKEHSFYISRYPAGREATVFDNQIDLKFRNDNPTAVMIQTVWTPSSLTVRIFGTKRFEVTSATGPRTDPTNPNTVTIPVGEPCSPSPGAPGFTVTDTRTLREISTGQVRSETRTVRYNPSPIVVCEG